MFWWPNIYGEVDHKVNIRNTQFPWKRSKIIILYINVKKQFQLITERGYELVDWDNLEVVDDPRATSAPKPRSSNGENDNEEQTMAQELNDLTKESWEVSTRGLG